MSRRVLSIAALCSLLGLILSFDSVAFSQDAQTVAATARRSVGVILVELNNSVASGTGFLVANGLVLTAYHVIEGGNRILLKFPGFSPVAARLMATDSRNDLAVLRVPSVSIPPLLLGDSASVQVGQAVVTIGFPRISALGTETSTLTQGIISAIRPGFLQMQVPISPGNSGGPVMTLRGEVIGVVAATLRGEQQGINFAVPINAAKALLGSAMMTAPAPVPQPQSPPSPSPTPLSPPTAASPYTVRVGPGAPIVIAYWLVVAGPDAALGVDSRRGIELAIDDAGATLLGHPIRLVGEDEGCNAQGGEIAATRIAGDADVVVAIGSNCSSAAVRGVPILWRAGIPTVSPSNTSPLLTDPNRGPNFDGYLRTAHNDKMQGITGAQFARNVLRVSRAATIHDGSPYAQGLVNAFADNFRQQGGIITTQEVVGPAETDMRLVLSRIASTRPELVYYPVFIAAGAFLTRQAKETDGLNNTTLMGADGLDSPDFVRSAGDAARGMYLTSPDLTPSALGPRYISMLLPEYVRKFGQRPISGFHAHAYDATMMILSAIQRVAQQDTTGNLYIDRKALRDALYATRNYSGMTGRLTCSPYGDCAEPHIAVFQIMNANPSTYQLGVDPARVYSGKF